MRREHSLMLKSFHDWMWHVRAELCLRQDSQEDLNDLNVQDSASRPQLQLMSAPDLWLGLGILAHQQAKISRPEWVGY